MVSRIAKSGSGHPPSVFLRRKGALVLFRRAKEAERRRIYGTVEADSDSDRRQGIQGVQGYSGGIPVSFFYFIYRLRPGGSLRIPFPDPGAHGPAAGEIRPAVVCG